MRSLQAIVVAGAAGFVGSGLVRRLLTAEGVERVAAIDLRPEEDGLRGLGRQREDPRLRYHALDIRDEEKMATLLRDMNATGVFNLAARRGNGKALDGNIMGTSALLRACHAANVPLLQASTDAVYGNVPSPQRATEEWPLNPSTPLAASMAAAEFLCLGAARGSGQDVVITRTATTYGPRLPSDHHLTRFIAAAMREEPISLPGDGMQIRDWIHLDDHCEGLLEAFRRAKSGSAYNLGGKCERTFLGIARSVLKVLHQPEDLLRKGPVRPGMDARRASDGTRMARYTGWFPRLDFKGSFPAVVRETAANLSHSADPTP